MKSTLRLTRRDWMAAAGAVSVTPSRDKLKIAAVGIGGMGAGYIKGCETEEFTALCDVDDTLAAKTYEKYPRASRYRDFRKMLDREKGIDAVIIGTPDHTHAAVARAAMQLGKHVYCAKPMTRTVAEARQLASLAREKRVATQMSVQSSMSPKACETVDWLRAGVAGKVREVHVWSDRPVWPQGLARPSEQPPVPETLDWNLWLGPAPDRPFHPVYHPFNWRGWVDFGTGALGDMGCHTMHVIVRALDLGAPLSVHASAPVHYQPAFGEDREMNWIRAKRFQWSETFPAASVVTWHFPNDVRVTWYDGGLRPPGAPAVDGKFPPAGILFVGDKGTIYSGFTGGPSWLDRKKQAEFTAPPARSVPVENHYQEWVAAAKGAAQASCEFTFAAHITEICLLGAIAQRFPGRPLEWDARAMKFTNDRDANLLVREEDRAGW